MKRRILVLCVIILLAGAVFASCNMENNEGTTTTKANETTSNKALTEASTAVENGLTDLSEMVSEGLTDLSEGISNAITSVSDAL